jgi:Uma2 family endonuclease
MQTRIKPTPGMAMSPEEYEEFVLGEPDGTWELVGGRLREKPAMSEGHDTTAFELAVSLRNQVDPRRYRVSNNAAKLQRVDRSYFVPDVVVLPITGGPGQPASRRAFNAYATPALLVVEVWSPSTARYDVEEKLRAYQERGDLEIWHLHPFDHTLTAWRRRPDGGYDEVVFRGGPVTPSTLPGVTIDLDTLFI